MEIETLSNEPTLIIKRMILQPGESSNWHIDQCRRFSVIVSGTRLRIEYRDPASFDEFSVHPGMVGWDTPESRVHRATNVGETSYEEVVTFYRDSESVDPQPEIHPNDSL